MKKPVGMRRTIITMPTRYLRPSGNLSDTKPVNGATNSEMSMMIEDSDEAVCASKPSCVSRNVL